MLWTGTICRWWCWGRGVGRRWFRIIRFLITEQFHFSQCFRSVTTGWWHFIVVKRGFKCQFTTFIFIRRCNLFLATDYNAFSHRFRRQLDRQLSKTVFEQKKNSRKNFSVNRCTRFSRSTNNWFLFSESTLKNHQWFSFFFVFGLRELLDRYRHLEISKTITTSPPFI